MKTKDLSLGTVVTRTAVVHTVTYLIVGVLALTILDYRTLFSESALSSIMRPVSDPIVMAGTLFQPLRGILFGVVFYLLRDAFFSRKHGWLTLWLTLIVIGILSTFGPTPGSVEGLVYTTIPVAVQLTGLSEVFLQSFLLSVVLFYWLNHSEKRWLTRTMWAAFVLALVMPILGLLVGDQG